MASESIAALFALDGVKAGAFTNRRLEAICSDYETSRQRLSLDGDAATRKLHVPRAPNEIHFGRLRSFDEQPVQLKTAKAQAVAVREIGLDGRGAITEKDPSEREPEAGVEFNTQLAQRCETIRHEAFTARLIDRRYGAIHHGY